MASTEEDSKKENSSTDSKTEDEDKAGRANIPQAVFVEDVDKFMQDPKNPSAEVVLKRFDEQHTKYKFMEANLIEKKKRYRSRIPDIQKSLDMIKFLKSKQDSKEPVTTQYLLSGGVYAYADVPPTDTVFLWLGANVMLEYPIDEAEALLMKNLSNAKRSLVVVDEDLEFITDQCTTIEVAMTRVYNWDVKNRRANKSEAAKN